jgi:hypothetical protein
MKDEMWLGWFPKFRSGWDNSCDHILSHILWHIFFLLKGFKQGGERQFSSQCQHQEQSMAELCPSAHHAYALGTLALPIWVFPIGIAIIAYWQLSHWWFLSRERCRCFRLRRGTLRCGSGALASLPLLSLRCGILAQVDPVTNPIESKL